MKQRGGAYGGPRKYRTAYWKDVPNGAKRCISCERILQALYFHRNKNAPDGLVNECNDCVRNKMLLKAYGITFQQYLELLEKQNGCCAICKEKPKIGKLLATDHDHKTNKVRGLLCDNCNAGLGWFRDRTELLISAVQYLEQSKEV